MMDESFDPFGGNTSAAPGNGWGGAGGDSSFVGTQAAPKANEYDRVALPVTVATLNMLQPDSENIHFGKYGFSQVRVVGEVVSSSKSENLSEHRYMVRDFGNEDQNPFLIVKYTGVEANHEEPFIQGSVIHAIGKVRSFDGQSAILAFKIFEITDPQYRDVFPKEARVAELYFTKDVPSRYANNEMGSFVGTFLSPEAPQSNTKTNAATPGGPLKNAGAIVDSKFNGSALYGATQHAGRGSNPQQNRILEYFATHLLNPDEGLNVTAIRAGINGNARFDEDINELAQNGVIYTTVDDNHYAVVTEH